MPILVTLCNSRISGTPCLAVVDERTGEVRIPRLPEELAGVVSATGLALSDRHLFVALQDPGSRLAIFDRDSLALVNIVALDTMADVHSLWLDGDTLYAVSTGTDEVYRLQLRGAEILQTEVFWRPDEKVARSDQHHLNAIFGFRGNLYVTGFGRKPAAGWREANDGFVANLTADRMEVTGILHPHSLIAIGDDLVYCESRKASVQFVGSSRLRELPGYTRGLCVSDSHLFVGTSVGRRLSKSTGEAVAEENPAMLTGTCAVYRLSVDTLAVEDVIDFSACGHEIYDLLPISRTESWPIVPTDEWQGRLLRHALSTLDRQQSRTNIGDTFTGQDKERHYIRQQLAMEGQIAELRAALESANAASTGRLSRAGRAVFRVGKRAVAGALSGRRRG